MSCHSQTTEIHARQRRVTWVEPTARRQRPGVCQSVLRAGSAATGKPHHAHVTPRFADRAVPVSANPAQLYASQRETRLHPLREPAISGGARGCGACHLGITKTERSLMSTGRCSGRCRLNTACCLQDYILGEAYTSAGSRASRTEHLDPKALLQHTASFPASRPCRVETGNRPMHFAYSSAAAFNAGIVFPNRIGRISAACSS